MFTDVQEFWFAVALCTWFVWYWNRRNGSTHAQRVGAVIGVALSLVSIPVRKAQYNWQPPGSGIPVFVFLAGLLGAWVAHMLNDMRKNEQDD